MNESSLRLTIACYQLLCLREFSIIFQIVLFIHSFIDTPGFDKPLFQLLSLPCDRSGLAVLDGDKTCSQ